MSLFGELGVEPVWNACGTVTRLGGARMAPEVLQAFCRAADEAVSLEELHLAAGRRIAGYTGAEAALVTSGASAGLTLGAAAILAGFDFGRMERLPQTHGVPHHFLVAREHRNGYDHAVRAAGVEFIEVGFNELTSGAGVRRTETWEYQAAVSPEVVGVLYVLTADSRPPLEEVVRVAHEADLPVLVDASAELPPRNNLSSIVATGADLVVFSGGKAIRGPQSTGILTGRRDLVGSAALQMIDMDDHPDLWEPPEDWLGPIRPTGPPRHGIGRGFKVSKEEIVALLVALDRFVRGLYADDWPRYEQRLKAIAERLANLPVTCSLIRPGHPEQIPSLEIDLGGPAAATNAFEACRQLRRGRPRIFVGHARLPEGKLLINPSCLPETADQPLTDRLIEVLTAGCSPR